MNWYQKIKSAQYFEDNPQGMNYLDVGHQGWGTPTANQPYRKNIVKECIWLVDKNFKLHTQCGDHLDHTDSFPMLLKGLMASGRYVEFEDKKPMLTFSTPIPTYSHDYQYRVERIQSMLDKEFNYPLMYKL